MRDVIQNEKNRRLYGVMNLLPAREREIIVLYYFGGISQDSIARHMKLSPGNVRILLHRTKSRLKKELEKEEDITHEIS